MKFTQLALDRMFGVLIFLFFTALASGCSGNDGATAFLAMMAGDERLSKDLESVKSAEDFTNALNAYSDKVDVFISKTATFDKAAYDNMDKKLEQAKVPMTMTEEDGKAMNIAIANLGLKFNTSPKVVKAYTRYVRALSKLMELAKRRDQLQK